MAVEVGEGAGRRRPGAATVPSSTTWLSTRDAERLLQEAPSPPGRAPPGRRSPGRWPAPGPAGPRRSRTSACPPRSACPGRGRVSAALRAWPASTSGVDRVGRHHGLPLGPLGVADLDRDRAALGLAVPDAAEDGDRVGLELHPGAAAEAEPAPGQRVGDVVGASPARAPAAPRGSPTSAGPWDSPAVSHRAWAQSSTRAARRAERLVPVASGPRRAARPARAPSGSPAATLRPVISSTWSSAWPTSRSRPLTHAARRRPAPRRPARVGHGS